MNPRVSRIRPILRPEQRRREREKKTRRRARDAIHRLRLEPRRARRTASSDPCAYDAHTKSRARRQSPRARASSPSPRAPPLGSTVDHHPRHASPPTTRCRDARARARTLFQRLRPLVPRAPRRDRRRREERRVRRARGRCPRRHRRARATPDAAPETRRHRRDETRHQRRHRARPVDAVESSRGTTARGVLCRHSTVTPNRPRDAR